VVDETQQYSAVEMERMMRVQDVLLKAMAKKLSWGEAAEILGVSDRTMRRWHERLEKHGYVGLGDRRKGGQGQHGGDPRATVADRQDAVPPQLGGNHGNDPRTSG
jgi:hypothetical protein